MAWSERLTAVDAMFLDIEDRCAHMHVGGTLVLAGRPPPQDDFVAYVASRLDRVQRYRQRLAFVPWRLGRPVWVDDASLDVAHHVGRTVLPAGGDRALRDVAARFFSEPLDRARPLWRLEVVEGVGPDRWALLSKAHHCLYDGIGGMDFLGVITDERPCADAPGAAPAWRPRPAPGRLELVAGAVLDLVARPFRLAAGALSADGEGRRVLRDLAAGARPLAELALCWPAPRWPLDQRIGPDRAWETVSLDLATVKDVGRALRGTVNHVMLAVVAGALRTVLAGRGDPLPEELRVFVPVNVRTPDARGTFGNRVSLVFCPVPVAEPDAVERLRRISEAARRLNERREAVGILAFEHLGDLTPAAVAAGASRVVVGMHFFNLVVSNIPGPAAPRSLLGRRLIACHPMIPLAAGQSLSIGLLSYAGAIDVGLLGAAERARDLAALARALPDALHELVRAAERAPARRRAEGGPGPPAVEPPGAPQTPATERSVRSSRR